MGPIEVDRLDTEEKRELAADAAKRAAGISARYARIFPEYRDEIESSALWGAMRAASNYKPECGKWERWQALCVRGEIQEFIRSYWRMHRKELEPEEFDAIQAPEPAKPLESNESFDRMIRHLTPTQRMLVSLVYKDGLEPAEAGRRMGLSAFRGCYVLRESLDKLRKILAA